MGKAEANRRWYLKTREVRLQWFRERYQKNREKHLLACRKYHQENKAAISKRKKFYQIENAEKINEYMKRRYAENPEKGRSAQRALYWKNRERIAIQRRERRKRKRLQRDLDRWAKQREAEYHEMWREYTKNLEANKRANLNWVSSKSTFMPMHPIRYLTDNKPRF